VIIDTFKCGLCVDPLDPDAVAHAIDALGADPVAAQEMGANGRGAVLAHFNWERELERLLALYAQLLNCAPAPCLAPIPLADKKVQRC
jgi:glycosyltransferase involved in cell wall biosynthesis